ncbi:MAG: NUDIX domain-containing protein [Chloroflexota bacterium]
MNDHQSKPAPFTTLSSHIAWSCPWYSVRQDRILLPDGQEGQYNVVQHEGAVWIVPLTTSREIVLLNHYRHTVQDWCFELPAGGLRKGESPQTVARKELREEIGGEAQSWSYVGQFYTSNGISNEVAHIFLATGVTLHETAHEPAEVMEIYPVALDEALRMARANEISDGPSALALLLSESRLRDAPQSNGRAGDDDNLNAENS